MDRNTFKFGKNRYQYFDTNLDNEGQNLNKDIDKINTLIQNKERCEIKLFNSIWTSFPIKSNDIDNINYFLSMLKDNIKSIVGKYSNYNTIIKYLIASEKNMNLY